MITQSWEYANGDHLVFTTESFKPQIVHAALSHTVGGRATISKYAGGTFVRNGLNSTVTLPNAHAHRRLKGNFHRDINGDGRNDDVPNIALPAGRTDLLIFNSQASWGSNFLFFRRYSLRGVIHVHGAIKDLNSNLANIWYSFDLIGDSAREFMRLFNTTQNNFDRQKTARGAAIAATTVTSVFFVAAATILCFALFGPAGAVVYAAAAGIAGMTVGGVVGSGILWGQAENNRQAMQDSQFALEAFVQPKALLTYTL
jgi:hypothetical protein